MRTYSAAEAEALSAALPVTGAHRGPAQSACGPYYPTELRYRAEEYERLIPLLRLAAEALEREIAADPRCSDRRADPHA